MRLRSSPKACTFPLTGDLSPVSAVQDDQTCCGAAAGNTYLVFAAVGAVALLTIYLTVPETRGKTLEEIEDMFAGEGKGE